jgi:hypothetical protein
VKEPPRPYGVEKAASANLKVTVMSYFESYAFKNLTNGHTEEITGMSYVGAAFLGPIYILFHGFWGRFFLHFLIIQPLVVAITLVATTYTLGLVSVGAGSIAWILAYLVLSAKVNVGGVRQAYLRAGWQEVGV